MCISKDVYMLYVHVSFVRLTNYFIVNYMYTYMCHFLDLLIIAQVIRFSLDLIIPK